MSHAKKASAALTNFMQDQDKAEEVEGIAVGCQYCYEQPDHVYFNRAYRLLFWECRNGHKGFIEDFDLIG